MCTLLRRSRAQTFQAASSGAEAEPQAVSGSPEPEPEAASGGPRAQPQVLEVIVPGLDFCNHDAHATCRWAVEGERVNTPSPINLFWLVYCSIALLFLSNCGLRL